MKDKTYFISGGLGLLGAAFVKDLLGRDANLIIADIADDISTQLQSELNEMSYAGNYIYTKMDITSSESIDAAIELGIDRFTKIDGFVNTSFPRNSSYGKDVMEISYEDFCENLNINLGGYFLSSQKFIHHFLGQGYGNIINISSIYGIIAPRFSIYKDTEINSPVEYAAIKSGLMHITKYFAKYLKGKNIRLNTISPGGIFDNHEDLFAANYSEYTLNKGMLDPSDICGTLAFLLSNESHYINGQNIVVDDGFTI